MDNLETSSSSGDHFNYAPSAIDTLEVAPSTRAYRSFGFKRSTASYIRSGSPRDTECPSLEEPKKLGGNFSMFTGVFLRCVSNITSVVYYLRIGWITGQCGLGLSLVLIAFCTVGTVFTSFSMSVLGTNGIVKGGGIYYFISRSLGVDFGGTIGVVYGFATTFSTCLHVFGFCEAVHNLIGHDITENGKFDIPIVGISLITLLVITICLSLKFEFVFQYLMILFMYAAIFAALLGPLLPGKPQWKLENLKNNWAPHFSKDQNFWSVYAIFFPACTGIMAGSNISGDLKNAQKSIPIGTLLAICFTSFIYGFTMIAVAAVADRETLLNSHSLLQDISLYRWIVEVGILAGSVSSASIHMVSGPKIFQALFKDEICPRFFTFLAWGKKNSNDPLILVGIAYVMVICCTFIFKDLNAVDPVVTLFYLLSYAFIHISALVARMSRSPSWRPSWKVFHPLTAIIGGGILVASMFLIDWIFSLIVCGIAVLLFMYFHWSDQSNDKWGGFPTSLLFTNTIGNLIKLKENQKHVKTYRPQIEFVVHYDFSDTDLQFHNVLPYTYMMKESYSYISVSALGNEVPDTLTAPEDIKSLDRLFYKRWKLVEPATFPRLLSTATQYGKLGPNIIAIPYIPSMRESSTIYDIVGSALDNKMGVTISRNFEKFDEKTKYKTTIDVWWLVDDGGLIILFAHLISKCANWKKCALRVFAALSKDQKHEKISIQMSKLLKYFRIEAEVVVVSLDGEPSEEIKNKWSHYNTSNIDQLTANKVPLFLRLREVILERSDSSSIIFCSMLIPRKTTDPISWLSIIDIVSDSIPNFVWVHGNNENVLTFVA